MVARVSGRQAALSLLVGAVPAAILSLSMSLPVAAKVHLRWSAGVYTGERMKMCNELVATFSKANPDLDVAFETKGFDNLIVQSASGTPPDVVWGWGEQYWPLVQNGLLLDLTPNFTKDFDTSVFIPETLEAAKYKGRIYSVDGRPTTMFLFYNSQLFSESGVTDANKLDEAGQWNRDTFLEVCRKLTRDVNGDGKPEVYGHSLRVGSEYAASWVFSDGGRYFSDDRKKYVVDDPGTVRTIQYFYDMFTQWKVAEAPGKGQDYPGFQKSKVATIQAGAWDFGLYRSTAKFQWDIVGVPTASKGRVSAFIPGGAYWIMRGTKHPKEAWRLVKWLYGPVAEKIVAKWGDIPMTIPGITAPEYTKPPSGLPKHMSLVTELMKNSKPIYYPPYSTRWNPTIDPIWSKIWSGRVSVAQGLAEISKEGTKIIASTKF